MDVQDLYVSYSDHFIAHLSKDEARLYEAVLEENIEAVSDLITSGANVNLKNYWGGTTPLELAAESQNVDISKLLLDSGAELNAIDKKKIISLLVRSIKSYNISFLKLLIKAGADVNAKDETGYTLLYHAVESQNVDIIKLLIEAGADVNEISGTKKSKSAIFAAIKFRNCNVLKLLIESGANVNQNYDNKNSLLHEAVKWGNLNIIKFLLDAGANVDAIGKYQYVPLYLAIRSNKINVVKVLTNAGANVNSMKGDERTLLHCAVEVENIDILKFLIARNIDVNPKNNNVQYLSPLHDAITFKNEMILKLLLDAGTNINAQDMNGATPLHQATLFEDFNIIKLLICAGADANKFRNHGRIMKRIPFMDFIYIINKSVDEVSVEKITRLLIESTNINLTNADGKNVFIKILKDDLALALPFESTLKTIITKKYFNKIILEHVAKLKALDLPVDSSLLDFITLGKDNDYFFMCAKELEKAKNTKLYKCWVTFFNLLVDDESKLVKYAGNDDLVKDFEKHVKNFSIYGAVIQSNIEEGIKGRKSFDNAANVLSYFLPIFNPTHLIIRDILDVMCKKDWAKIRQ